MLPGRKHFLMCARNINLVHVSTEYLLSACMLASYVLVQHTYVGTSSASVYIALGALRRGGSRSLKELRYHVSVGALRRGCIRLWMCVYRICPNISRSFSTKL